MKPAVIKLWLVLLFAGLFIPKQNIAQTLQFGTEVTSSGYLSNQSNSFTISREGSYVYFFVTMPYAIGYAADIEYRIYRINSYGEEIYESTITQQVQADWAYFWKQVTFYSPGKYRVYVYDVDYLYGDDAYLTSADINISYK